MQQPTNGKPEQQKASAVQMENSKVNLNPDEKYRILFEKSKDAILIIENQTFVDCNKATLDMLGYKNKAEFLGTHPSELSPEFQADGQDSFTKSKKMITKALNNGSHRFEWNHLKANGDVFPVEVLLTTISNEKDNEIIHTIWRDITYRKKVEHNRQKEKDTLFTILESIPHGIALINAQGNYQYVNPHFTKITGYTIGDIPNKKVWFEKAYPDPEYRKEVINAWTQDIIDADVGEKYREFNVVCKNGESKHIEFRSTFLNDIKLTVLTDATDRKKSEEMIREKDRLQGVLELSGAVCHEMNQPLMSIQGYFDLLIMDIPDDDPMHERINKIQEQIERLTNITKKLMEISRYETKDYLQEKIVDIAKASKNRS